MKNIFVKLSNLDRRIIYIALFIVLVLAFFIKPGKLSISKNVKDVYDAIEKLAEENEKSTRKKIALVVADWDAAVMAECDPQTEAIITHLMKRNIKFAILSMVPVGPAYAEDVAVRVAKRFKEEYGIEKVYGIDWCNWGYKRAEAAVYRTLPKDLYAIVQKDIKGTNVKEIPMMKDVESFDDIGVVFHAAGSAMILSWLSYVRNDIKAPIVAACTGIMSPEYANYWATGQIKGYLGAMIGAAEYEQLLDVYRKGRRAMAAQNYGHILIILFIIIGNIGYFLSKKQ
jgi:hypothetical protein